MTPQQEEADKIDCALCSLSGRARAVGLNDLAVAIDDARYLARQEMTDKQREASQY